MQTRGGKRKKFSRHMRTKLAVYFLVIILALGGLGIRIFYINYKNNSQYTVQVLNQQQYTTKMLPFRRGDIVDRNGTVLATSVQVYNLILDPYIMFSDEDYLEPTVKALLSCFPQLEEGALRSKLLEEKSSRYVVELKELTYDEVKGFQKMQKEDKDNNIQGVWFETKYKREYPYGYVGSDVVGFVYDGNVADWGLEGYYNDVLNGTNGREYGYVNQDNLQEKIIKKAIDGSSLHTTIDLQVQTVLEKHLKAYIDKYHPKNVAIIVADPNNGEILGMTCNEQYDNNNPRDLSQWYTKEQQDAMSDEEMFKVFNRIWRNYCINDSYEPGSTMKPFTVAACYEEGLVNANTTFVCDGVEQVGGWNIHCWSRGGHGKINLAESLMESCNDALMDMGRRLKPELTEAYQNLFGFGYQCGIDLPGETEGITVSAANMDEATLVTNAFGQNMNVNMMQMVAGFSALINGGNYYTPHIVKEVISSAGTVEKENTPTLMKKVITEETSKYIRFALKRTAEDGTGRRAAVDGYLVGGKTGTGEKYGEDGKRMDSEYVISFIGYAANEEANPEVVCYVVCDGPQGLADATDNTSACHLWRDVMAELMPYLGIYTIAENTGAN